MLPNDKAKKVKELQQEGKVVAFVGDGVNDSVGSREKQIRDRET